MSCFCIDSCDLTLIALHLENQKLLFTDIFWFQGKNPAHNFCFVVPVEMEVIALPPED